MIYIHTSHQKVRRDEDEEREREGKLKYPSKIMSPAG